VTVSGRMRLSVGITVAVLLALVLCPRAEAQPRPEPAQQPPPVTIKELTVEGNRRVQEAVVLGPVKSRIGGPFNPSQLSEDVRSIFALGFFDDVQVRVEDFEGGVKLTFVVTERPFVRDIDFVGNQKIPTNTLTEKIDLKLGRVYNPVDVQRARDKLVDHYEEEGYYEVQITPQTDKFPDGDVRVLFSINEGRRMTIDHIVIQGNQGLTAQQIKNAMATQERQYFILRGTVQRQRLEDDVERIIALYNDYGYIQARVESHDVTVDRDRARVTVNITVVEGPQYRVGDVRVSGVTLLPEEEVRRQFLLKPGDVFSRSKVRDSLRSMTDLYSTIGRASADILPRTEPHADTQRIDIAIEVTEGPEVYVERININGNVRSQDKILRREIPMAEGDLFTLQNLQRAKQKLVNLGYFETVNVTTQPGSDKTKIVVNVDVTERPTGLFSIGGGFSSVDSFIGTIDLSQRNFLGRGWELSLRLRGGGRTQQGSLSFTEPWLFDRPLSAGFDLFDVRRQFTEYDVDSLGGGVRLSHPFGEFSRWHLGYRLENDKISNLSDVAAITLRDEKGNRLTSLISAALTRDSRDNILLPTKGGQASISTEFAGLAGDSQFVKSIASVSYFQPIWFDHILSGRAEVGYGIGWAHKPLPLFERFYLGGPNSVRGLKFRKISPIDEGGTRIGGSSELLGNLEYIIPLPLNIRLAGFVDVGNVYGPDVRLRDKYPSTLPDPTDLREAAGAGLRWNSPFGPIRVDYGINLDRRAGEDFGAFHFSVGSPF
jgi:outer membrane protein insertion porin family